MAYRKYANNSFPTPDNQLLFENNYANLKEWSFSNLNKVFAENENAKICTLVGHFDAAFPGARPGASSPLLTQKLGRSIDLHP